MEPLTAYPLRCSGPKAKVLAVLLSMVLCTVMLFLLQLKFLKPKINSFYTFEVKDANGRTVSLEKFKGKVALVVNVASDCQLTDRNYLALQELHKEFGPFHFSVLAFPCNQFGESEPRPSKEVVSFARSNFGVTFPIFHKIKILGPEAEPAFRFLIGSSLPPPLPVLILRILPRPHGLSLLCPLFLGELSLLISKACSDWVSHIT
ncbi:probable glutathione peroxidase 8 isoform X2 [Hippopotamus amphibius kiboko]|uniref:probable glutathione peroxidase 8 isoform X2 n=1 Tax=Hippopotamus amphibius kiboko TaxID=575201 RepID=UPI002596F843|nr:probable glutathione peroxidase 8 isoform X2 [Hippopotamus amphibius kiboko]